MQASEIALNVLFYVFAAGAIGGAVSVAAGRNIVRSAFSLLAVLVSAAALYAIMKADFVAAAQVLIYVGGILVLILFAVMLTHRIADVRLSNESAPGPAAFFACLCLLFSLVMVVLSFGKWERDAEWRTVRVREAGGGEVPLDLALYQADGRTGLEKGGDTREDRAVVAVKAGTAAAGWPEVEIEAFSPGKGNLPAAGGSAPFAAGMARIELRGLPEGPCALRLRLRRGEGDASEWAGHDPRAARPAGIDFHVQRGLTKPLARAFMGPYLLAFEAISLLLLAALVGAVTRARKEVRE